MRDLARKETRHGDRQCAQCSPNRISSEKALAFVNLGGVTAHGWLFAADDMKTHELLIASLGFVLGCGSGDQSTNSDSASIAASSASTGGSEFAELPFTSGGDAPVLTSLTLQCSAPSDPNGIVSADIVVTDPQGLADLDGISQSLRVYRDLDGGGQPTAVVFAVDASLAMTYCGGNACTLFEGPSFSDVRTALCAATWWPAEVAITDSSGHATTGKVRATLIQ